MITEITIKNYKSILSETIPLSNVNVFIGENGCGKTNILEAVAMFSAAIKDDLSIQNLGNKGVRIAKPSLTISSFLQHKSTKHIEIDALEGVGDDWDELSCSLYSDNKDDIYSTWKDKNNTQIKDIDLINKMNTAFPEFLNKEEYRKQFEWLFNFKYENQFIIDYLIYNLSTQALRGISNDSLAQPLGIFGEGLDVLLMNFSKDEWIELKKFNHLISWLDEIVIDEKDLLKYKGHKLGRSRSQLYFRDRFMRKNNNVFSAENANEGILHILFYLALFISKRTPAFFGIDNIETALNPKLCRVLMKEISQLAVKNNKQALITTHNPAVLDGMNLHDPNQRLFVVKRTDEGYTKVEQIKLKPETQEKNLKLSEMWMRGYLGGIPNNF
jgi:AAA15 family ATPase/GTPase